MVRYSIKLKLVYTRAQEFKNSPSEILMARYPDSLVTVQGPEQLHFIHLYKVSYIQATSQLTSIWYLYSVIPSKKDTLPRR